MNIAKYLIAAGVVLIAIGLLWGVLGKYVHLGRLPGDIAVQKGNVKFYFPIVTCIVVSIVLSVIGYLAKWLMK